MPRNRKLWVIEWADKPGGDWWVYDSYSTRREARDVCGFLTRDSKRYEETDKFRVVKYVPGQ